MNLIDKANKLKSEMPCTFYGKVRFHGEDAEAEYLCCLCSQKKAMELAKNDAFDENIFYYYESISEIEESIFGNGDFVLLDIDLNSVEKVEL